VSIKCLPLKLLRYLWPQQWNFNCRNTDFSTYSSRAIQLNSSRAVSLPLYTLLPKECGPHFGGDGNRLPSPCWPCWPCWLELVGVTGGAAEVLSRGSDLRSLTQQTYGVRPTPLGHTESRKKVLSCRLTNVCWTKESRGGQSYMDKHWPCSWLGFLQAAQQK